MMIPSAASKTNYFNSRRTIAHRKTKMRLFDVSGESTLSVGRTLRGFVVGAVALTAAVQIGCESRSAPISTSNKTSPPNSKVGKLERVMERLKEALAAAQPAAGSGVESERKYSYRLIRPENEQSDFKAEVTIVTRTKLAITDAATAAKSGGPVATGPSKQPASAESRKPLQKKEVFVLVYEGDRWKLLTEPEGEVERSVFEYALDL